MLAGHGPGATARRRGSRSAPSTPTSRSATTTDAAFDAATGVNHERTEVRDEAGEVADGRSLDRTASRPRSCGCSPAPRASTVDAIWSVEPGAYAAPAARRRAPRTAPLVPPAHRESVRRVMTGELTQRSAAERAVGGSAWRCYPAGPALLTVRTTHSVRRKQNLPCPSPRPPPLLPMPAWAPSTRRARTPRARSPRTTSACRFADAIDGTLVDVEDGQIVQGTVVKVDKDEVLLDIGYKSEGVIPSRELSIRNDVDPHEVVSLGDEIEALVLTEGGQGGPPRPVEEAGPVRAGVGHDREDQGSRRRRRGSGHRGRQGRPHPRHRPARLPAGLARRAAPCPRPPAVRRPGRCRPRSSSSTRTATTSCCPAAPTSRRRRRSSARTSSPT